MQVGGFPSKESTRLRFAQAIPASWQSQIAKGTPLGNEEAPHLSSSNKRDFLAIKSYQGWTAETQLPVQAPFDRKTNDY